jgi:hypothetical protein
LGEVRETVLDRFRAWLKRREDEMTAELAPTEGEEVARLIARVQIDTVFLYPTGVAMLPFWVWLTHGGGLLALIGTALFGVPCAWFTLAGVRNVVRMFRARRDYRLRSAGPRPPSSKEGGDHDANA